MPLPETGISTERPPRFAVRAGGQRNPVRVAYRKAPDVLFSRFQREGVQKFHAAAVEYMDIQFDCQADSLCPFRSARHCPQLRTEAGFPMRVAVERIGEFHGGQEGGAPEHGEKQR
ncbi:hypothetical protein SDC9_196268 [bioreactor metagenome]|uniref:Uncharacterized protein n=1 Tax=bioreactor metagenome TaxID=1076179 RepID=A0A645IBP7_9ZZZZ